MKFLKSSDLSHKSWIIVVGKFYIIILLYISLKWKINLAVPFILGIIKAGVAHSELLIFFNAHVLTNVSTLFLRVGSWIVGIGEGFVWLGLALISTLPPLQYGCSRQEFFLSHFQFFVLSCYMKKTAHPLQDRVNTFRLLVLSYAKIKYFLFEPVYLHLSQNRITNRWAKPFSTLKDELLGLLFFLAYEAEAVHISNSSLHIPLSIKKTKSQSIQYVKISFWYWWLFSVNSTTCFRNLSISVVHSCCNLIWFSLYLTSSLSICILRISALRIMSLSATFFPN